MSDNRINISVTLILAIVALAVLAVHVNHYLPFIADDALISLRYSQRLLAGQGLTWNPGERVEGYSNLLWVLCCAALGLAGIDLVTAARVLGVAGIAAAIGAILYAHRPQNFRAAFPFLLALLFLPLAAPIAVWAIGGMEQPLVAGLLAWAMVLCYRPLESTDEQTNWDRGRLARSERLQARESLWLPGFLFALLGLTRLDGALFTITAVAVVLIIGHAKREAWRKALTLAALPLLFTLLQIAFRRAYYGEWVPNTALVKFTPSFKHALDGWAYIRAGALPILPLIAVAASSVVVSIWKNFMRDRMILLSAMLLAWTAYVVVIGGDIFPAWRHFVPLLVLLVLMAAIGAEWIATHARRAQIITTSVVLVLLLGLFVVLQRRDSENLRAISERWEWDGRAVGMLLKQAFGKQQALMAVDPAGCLPYWSELTSIDMLGLNDYYLPRHPPPGVGQGAIGHELGDGQYVLNRQPDLVIFLLPTGNDRGYFLSGRQMQEDPRFFRDYTLVRFAAPEKIVSRIWVRRYSERIGIRQLDNQIDIPAFLLNGTDPTVAYLNATGELVVAASHVAPARIANLNVPPGRWRVQVVGQAVSLRVRVLKSSEVATNDTRREADRILLDAPVPAMLDIMQDGGAKITIEIFPETEGAVEIKQLQLSRFVK
jgi:arabinofuranosyltransferase